MAYDEHLPIYRKAMETAVYFENIVRNFSRYNKYNLGAEMRTKSRDIVKLIIKATQAETSYLRCMSLGSVLKSLRFLSGFQKNQKHFIISTHSSTQWSVLFQSANRTKDG